MNPFDQLNHSDLSGLESLSGFSFKKLKTKLKHTIRKVGKVAAPIAAGVFLGPAAGVAVGQAVLKHNKDVKNAKQAAKDVGMSWQQYKHASEDEIQAAYANKVAQETGNPSAVQLIDQARQTVDTMAQSPEAQNIRARLLQQGYSPNQVQALFNQSKPVREVVNTATAGAIYGGVRNAGYPPAQAAVTAGAAVQNAQNSDTLSKVLPFALPAVFLLAR